MDLNYYLISKIPIFVVILFVIASFYLFNLVYKTTENIIDELFHIPQGLAYCHGNFSRVSKIIDNFLHPIKSSVVRTNNTLVFQFRCENIYLDLIEVTCAGLRVSSAQGTSFNCIHPPIFEKNNLETQRTK